MVITTFLFKGLFEGFCQQYYDIVKVMVVKGVNFNLEKMGLLVTPLFETDSK
jgi:hypothetical protein